MSVFKSLVVAVFLIYLATCSSTLNKEGNNVTSQSARNSAKEVKKEILKEVPKTIDVEVFSGVRFLVAV